MSSISLKVDPLVKDNYETWKMQVEALLTKHDLWDFVSGEEKVPNSGSGDEAAFVAWKKKDKKAKSDLVLSIHPDELHHVRYCETSQEVWEKLESVFASKGPAKRANLLKQLMLTRLSEGSNMRDHVNKFHITLGKLRAMGVDPHPDILTICLLYSLPPSFENFRCAIESRDELPSVEKLSVKILEEAEARQKPPDVVENSEAFGANSRNYKENSNKKLFRIKCFKCHRIGHKSPQCPLNISKEEGANVANDTFDTFFSVIESLNQASTMDMLSNERSWILDSGCTAHLCGDADLFTQLNESVKGNINLANQSTSNIMGKGTVKLRVLNDQSSSKYVEFQDTLYVPEIRCNLVSVAKIVDKGYTVTFKRNMALVTDDCGNIKLRGERQGDLYFIRKALDMANVAETSVQSIIQKWHIRLGHLNAKDLLKTIKTITGKNYKLNEANFLSKCEICLKGKMSSVPFGKSERCSKDVLEIIHSDIVGPLRTQGLNGAKYFVTFIDDYSRWCEVYFLKQKSGVYEAFRAYQSKVERQTGRKIKCIQSDNGKEYCNEEFNNLLANQGIKRRLTVPYTPQQNGIAERMNRTILDMARCLLIQSSLPTIFWTEAIATACHIRNRSPSNSIQEMTPYEKWTQVKPSLNYLRAFGAEVYILNKNPSKGKFDDRSTKGVFVGYPRESKGYRIWLSEEKKIVHSRDVKFLNEEECYKKNNFNDTIFCEKEMWTPNAEMNEEEKESSPCVPHEEQGQSEVVSETLSVARQGMTRGKGRPRLIRTGSRGRPRRLFSSIENDQDFSQERKDTQEEMINNVFCGSAEISVNDALSSSNKEEWERSIQSEIISLIKYNTWDIVKSPKNTNIVGSKIVLTKKYAVDGSIGKYKARIVAKGYNQTFGVDYNSTFAPVARMETIRILLALSVELKMHICQLDIKTAFLNGDLEEEVYMEIPPKLPNFLEKITVDAEVEKEIRDRAMQMLTRLGDGDSVCKLNKAIYGLRQAGRQWHIRLTKSLNDIGLRSSNSEPCLFYSHREQTLLIIVIYVDDILIASQDRTWIVEVKAHLANDFEVKDLGAASYCLGFEIMRNEDSITISQKGYIMDILKKHGMERCNPIGTPAEVQGKENEDSETDIEEYPYRELIGSLLYLSVCTRPDIANTVSRLAQFTSNPKESHWKAGKRVLRYLAGTADVGLTYIQTGKSIFGYSDADWGGDLSDRHSFTGYVFFISGAAVSWKSQKQKTVALSSTEAEYISLSEAGKESLHLFNLLQEIRVQNMPHVTLYVDNRGAQQLAENSSYHPRTKHIDIRHHFIREVVSEGKVILKHVPSKQNVADVLTKPLPRIQHSESVKNLGMN